MSSALPPRTRRWLARPKNIARIECYGTCHPPDDRVREKWRSVIVERKATISTNALGRGLHAAFDMTRSPLHNQLFQLINQAIDRSERGQRRGLITCFARAQCSARMNEVTCIFRKARLLLRSGVDHAV